MNGSDDAVPGWLEAELFGETLGDHGKALVFVRLSDVYALENTSWGTIIRTRPGDRTFKVRAPYAEVAAALKMG